MSNKSELYPIVIVKEVMPAVCENRIGKPVCGAMPLPSAGTLIAWAGPLAKSGREITSAGTAETVNENTKSPPGVPLPDGNAPLNSPSSNWPSAASTIPFAELRSVAV